jgi:tetratricopeptide (TPR) repeat protein
LYQLAEAYLKSGDLAGAKRAVEQLDQISSGDYRTMTAIGVLLGRYRQYMDAIEQFQKAIESNPASDDEEFDLANAYFQSGQYSAALGAVKKISEEGSKDEAYLELLGDIEEHLGEGAKAEEVFRDAIRRSPDGDQGYLSLALLELRENDLEGAAHTLQVGQEHCPASGKLKWGIGIVAALNGDMAKATDNLERAVDLLPEWTGSYSLLGFFYFQTGQIGKAREVFDRFKSGGAAGDLDVNRISQVLAQSSSNSMHAEALTTTGKTQLLQFALSLADKTL